MPPGVARSARTLRLSVVRGCERRRFDCRKTRRPFGFLIAEYAPPLPVVMAPSAAMRAHPLPPPLALAAHTGVSKLLTTLMPGVEARQIHSLLVAANLFWYQAIRQCLGLLVVSMGLEFGYSTSEKGRLIAAPSVGNIITQLVGGLLEQKIGARATIAAAIMGLATGCTLMPLACSSSYTLALVVLAAQGFIFGPMFPAHSVLLSRWLTPSERGQAMAQGELAISLASMGVPLLIASVEAAFGWRAGFYATGLGCFAYLGVWLALAASRPSECAYLTPSEAATISGGQAAEASGPSAPPGGPSGVAKKQIDSEEEWKSSTDSVIPGVTREAYPVEESAPAAVAVADGTPASGWRVLTHPSVLALFLVHMVYNLTTLSINSWMPTYYAETLRLPPESAKMHLTLPHLAALGLKLYVASIGRTVRSHGVSLKASRRLMCAVGFATTAVALLLLPAVSDTSKHSVWLSTGLFCVALAGTGFHAEGFRANYLDVTRAHVGAVSGMGNCLSSVAAMGAPLIVGSMVQAYDGAWGPVWYASSGACAAAAAVFCTLSTATPVEATIVANRRVKAKAE